MPWKIEKRDGKFCVIKETDGSSSGCHATREKALAQQRALYASEASIMQEEEFCGGEVHVPVAPTKFNLGFLEGVIHHLKTALETAGDEATRYHILESVYMLKGKIAEKEAEEHEEAEATPYDEPQPAPMYSYGHFTEEEEALLASGGFREFPWSGPIVFEGVPTGDNRVFKAGAIEWDEGSLPWPFRWQKSSIKGHDGAVAIGRVDRLERREDGAIIGFGVIIPELNAEAAEYLRLMKAGVASGVSVDGDSAVFDVEQDEASGKERILFSSMRLRSLTAVDIPAFNQARVGLTDAETVEAGELDLEESFDEESEEFKKRKKKKHEIGNKAHKWAWAVTAAAIPVLPETEWFADPQLDGPTPITVTPDGHVYGHLALFGTCHIGFPGACVKPPKGSNYSYFHTGEIETAQGDLVEVGKLTFNTGHAEMAANPAAAASHYDHTGTVAADVRAGEDKFGIWVSGALRPHLTDEDIRAFRAAPLSGDWRRIAGRLELVGALAVNTPGFPVPRARALVASGETATLFTFTEEDVEETEILNRMDDLAAIVSSLTEFHLPGMHEQAEHGKGGRLGGFGGKSKAAKEFRKAYKSERKSNPEFKKFTNFLGGIKLKKLQSSEMADISDKHLSLLHTGLQQSMKSGKATAVFGALTLDPIMAGIGVYVTKKSGRQLGRVTRELNKRGIKAEANTKWSEEDLVLLTGDSLEFFNLLTFAEGDEEGGPELSLEQEIAKAKTDLAGKPAKKSVKLTPYAKDGILEVIDDLIAEGEEDGGDSDVPAALVAQLKAFKPKLEAIPTELLGDKATPAENAAETEEKAIEASARRLELAIRSGVIELAHGDEAEHKTEDGEAFPASDYAYVPDPKSPSTWKLRLTATPGGDPDPGIVGAAIAALGKGFRGNKAQIPAADLAAVKAKVKAAWIKANPEKEENEMPAFAGTVPPFIKAAMKKKWLKDNPDKTEEDLPPNLKD